MRAIKASLGMAVLWISAATWATERPVVNIGVVVDGRAPGKNELLLERVGDLLEIIERETQSLTERDFDVRFPADKLLIGDWDLQAIRSHLSTLLADDDVDLVLCAGVFSSNEAVRDENLPKPVIAIYAIDVEAQKIPKSIDAAGIRISGRDNLTYLTAPGSIDRDAAKFLELARFETLHILVDSQLYRAIPEVPRYASEKGRQAGLDFIPVPIGQSATEALAALPSDTEAVYITPLLRMPNQEFRALTDGINARKIPSFSLLGRIEVEQGIFAGLRTVADQQKSGRRVALDIQRILLGENASDLPVILDTPQRLAINMATARKIGVYPNWRTLTEADVLYRESREPVRTLTLAQAVREAVEVNLTLAAAEREVLADEQDVAIARSALRPQIDATATELQVREDTAEASFGSQAERSFSGGVSMTQVLYSDALRARLRSTRDLQRATELSRDTLRLDIALEAASAFLDVLRAETLERIELENLRLTESNLELARRRSDIGYSGPGEVFRWESELATDRSSLIRARNNVEAARALLNQILRRPQEELFTAERPELSDADLITSHQEMDPYVNNPASYRLFREFLVRQAMERSPEIRAVDAAIAAQRRTLRTARRGFWSPSISFFADASRDFSRSGAGSTSPLGGSGPPRDTWSAGVQASLPLVKGGARKAETRQAAERLAQLRLERAATVEQIELRVRTSAFAAGSSYPAIELAEEAAVAARKNRDLVTDSYSQGLADILDLLDAQNSALVADQAASNAIYDFLLDLMEVQRAADGLDFFESTADRDIWFRRLDAFFDEAGMTQR